MGTPGKPAGGAAGATATAGVVAAAGSFSMSRRWASAISRLVLAVSSRVCAASSRDRSRGVVEPDQESPGRTVAPSSTSTSATLPLTLATTWTCRIGSTTPLAATVRAIGPRVGGADRDRRRGGAEELPVDLHRADLVPEVGRRQAPRPVAIPSDHSTARRISSIPRFARNPHLRVICGKCHTATESQAFRGSRGCPEASRRPAGPAGPIVPPVPGRRRAVAWVLLLAYLAILGHLTLVRFYQVNPGYNLMPGRTIAHDLGKGGIEFLINTVGNLVATMPLGVLLPIVLPAPGRVGAAGGPGVVPRQRADRACASLAGPARRRRRRPDPQHARGAGSATASGSRGGGSESVADQALRQFRPEEAHRTPRPAPP